MKTAIRFIIFTLFRIVYQSFYFPKSLYGIESRSDYFAYYAIVIIITGVSTDLVMKLFDK